LSYRPGKRKDDFKTRRGRKKWGEIWQRTRRKGEGKKHRKRKKINLKL
jgi:hypothetical protein